jgi:hypothetical protein
MEAVFVSLTIEQARAIDQQVQRNQEAALLRLAQLERLQREAEAYAKLSRRIGLDRGWRVASQDSLARVAEKNPHVEVLVRQKVAEFPLTMKIETVDGFEFLVNRPIWALTDDELLSGPQYMEAFQKAVESGRCPARPWLAEEPKETTVEDHLAFVRAGFAQPVDEQQLAEITAKGAIAAAQRDARIRAQMNKEER